MAAPQDPMPTRTTERRLGQATSVGEIVLAVSNSRGVILQERADQTHE